MMGRIALLLGIGLALGTLFFARQRKTPTPSFDVPHAAGAIVIDGETDDSAWLASPGPARTGAFPPGRPFSEARMAWGDDMLYLSLYAADEDIRTRATTPDGPLWLDDSFRLTITARGTEYAIEVSPKCIVSDGRRAQQGHGRFDYGWQSGVHAACDTDGTINDSTDMDEEWVVELALPLNSVGVKPGEAFDLAIQRCDTPKSAQRVCTSWAHSVTLR